MNEESKKILEEIIKNYSILTTLHEISDKPIKLFNNPFKNYLLNKYKSVYLCKINIDGIPAYADYLYFIENKHLPEYLIIYDFSVKLKKSEKILKQIAPIDLFIPNISSIEIQLLSGEDISVNGKKITELDEETLKLLLSFLFIVSYEITD